LPGRNANAYTDPHAFTYRNSDSDGNSYTDSDRNGDGDTNPNITHAYTHCDGNSDTHGDPAAANAKAAAHAVPPADSVRRIEE
jgi:hypothetical protein